MNHRQSFHDYENLLKIMLAVIYYCFPKNPNIKNENYEKKRR